MYLFDLHCDTITECKKLNKSLIENDLHIDVDRGNKYEKWVQTFAFWLDDSLKGENAYQHFLDQRELLLNQINQNKEKICLYETGKEIEKNKCNVIMAVEGGHVLGGKIERVKELKKLGVSYLTLVWNSYNEIGSGVLGNGKGLTPFGKDVIKEMERVNIIVDVSHLNEVGFDDVCNIATKPIIATHSNAKSICNHDRNLNDNQLKYLIDHNGLCGINFYPLFINQADDCKYDDIIKHIEYILALGGKDILSIGTDFDGAKMPTQINGVERLYSFYEFMLKWYDNKILNKIFFENANNFVNENILIKL